MGYDHAIYYSKNASFKNKSDRQAQGIKIAKSKGVYKGRPILYSSTSKNPKYRAVFNAVVNDLAAGISISKIAKEYGMSRETVYRIKKDIEKDSL